MCECCCNASLSKLHVKKLLPCNVLFCLILPCQDKYNAQLNGYSCRQFFLVDVRSCQLPGMRMLFTLFAYRNLIGEVAVLEDMTSHLPVIEIRIEECRGKVFIGGLVIH